MAGWRLGARRDRAARYLFITIASFAVTVAGVRWFLDLTGYPQVGGGGLHVAHMLWGGLLLTIAAILPLLLVGRRMLMLAALLAGVGVGLFIDEVGKFITATNDYFFAPAAPLIYGALLLLVGLWLLVRRGRADTDADALQAGVEAVRDAVDGRLDAADRDRARERLAGIGPDGGADARALATDLLAVLSSPSVEAVLASPGWVARGDARRLLERLLPARLERALIVILLVLSTLQAALAALILLAVAWSQDPIRIDVPPGPIEFPADPIWAILSLVIAVGVGVASGVSVGLIVGRREGAGIRVAIGATVVNLIAGGLLTFYVEQFGAVGAALGQVVLLGLLLDRARRVTGSVSRGGTSATA